MKQLEARVRGVAFAAVALFSLAGAQSAFAAHGAADEVGRWAGFGHQTGQLADGSRITLDLAIPAAGGPPGALTGVLVGLPAVQRPVQVTGLVSPEGRLTLSLSGEGLTGFCDGSVRYLLGFGKRDGQDDIATLSYQVTDAAGVILRGRLNLIHYFGGSDWAQIQAPNLVGFGDGSVVPGGADVAGAASVSFDSELGSGVGGSLKIGDQAYAMVGTISGPGSTVMMCDGSVRNADGQISSLIGLLFTGGVRNLSPVGVPAVQHFVGRYGADGFADLLPAVQRMRPGAMSFLVSPSS